MSHSLCETCTRVLHTFFLGCRTVSIQKPNGRVDVISYVKYFQSLALSKKPGRRNWLRTRTAVNSLVRGHNTRSEATKRISTPPGSREALRSSCSHLAPTSDAGARLLLARVDVLVVLLSIKWDRPGFLRLRSSFLFAFQPVPHPTKRERGGRRSVRCVRHKLCCSQPLCSVVLL